MLERILQILATGGTHTLKHLAQQLDVSEELLESMIDELVHMGYLKPVHVKCGDDCNHCPTTGTCTSGGSGRVWVLRNYLEIHNRLYLRYQIRAQANLRRAR